MDNRFMVPQFIDAETRIIGPITTRQFLILLLTAGFEFVLFKLLTFWTFAVGGLFLLLFAIVIAFARINGMPFHYFLLNVLQTFRKPRLQVWDKRYTNSELRALMRNEVEPPPEAPPEKERLTSSKLQELSLVVNTGGVYHPDA
jgi:hypothetical protein